MINPKFGNINRLFVLSIKNDDNDPARDVFDKYYMPVEKTKYFNALIGNKTFFHQPIKSKQKDLKLKDINYQKNYNLIANGKRFYDQSYGSDIKQY